MLLLKGYSRQGVGGVIPAERLLHQGGRDRASEWCAFVLTLVNSHPQKGPSLFDPMVYPSPLQGQVSFRDGVSLIHRLDLLSPFFPRILS